MISGFASWASDQASLLKAGLKGEVSVVGHLARAFDIGCFRAPPDRTQGMNFL